MRRGKGSSEDLDHLYPRRGDSRIPLHDRRRVADNFRRIKAARAHPWSLRGMIYRIRRAFERLFPR